MHTYIPMYIYVYTCIYISLSIYIYIYMQIDRERERERDREILSACIVQAELGLAEEDGKINLYGLV